MKPEVESHHGAKEREREREEVRERDWEEKSESAR